MERVITEVKNEAVKRQNIALQLKILSQNKRVSGVINNIQNKVRSH